MVLTVDLSFCSLDLSYCSLLLRELEVMMYDFSSNNFTMKCVIILILLKKSQYVPSVENSTNIFVLQVKLFHNA